MGIYSNPELLNWFVSEYPKHSKQKLDMGKSCVRFKKLDEIPYKLIGELMQKMSVEDWVNIYESNLDRKSTRLNSSHVRISYAVFCLKKKKKKKKKNKNKRKKRN